MDSRIDIMGVHFDNLTMEQAVSYAASCMENGNKCRVVTPGTEHGLACRKDKALLQSINTAQLVIPDSTGVIKASNILKTPLKERVAGIDFAKELCKWMGEHEKKLFLYGAKPEVVKKAAENLKAEYPGLVIAGTLDGYTNDEEKDVEFINAAGADALFVCKGAPKQELFMEKYQDTLDCLVLAGLGGSLDIFSGELKRAPEVFIRHNLEWLYRLIKQPSRIKRMIKLPMYLLYAIREKKGK